MRTTMLLFLLLSPTMARGASDLEFRISTDKQEYLPIEPIFITCTIVNLGTKSIDVSEPCHIDNVVSVESAATGKPFELLQKPNVEPGETLETDARRFLLKPEQKISHSFEMNPFEAIETSAGLAPGKYSLRGSYFLFTKSNQLPFPVPANFQIASSVIEFVVRKPNSVEAAEIHDLQVAKIRSEESGGELAPLEKFLESHPQSRYRYRGLAFMSAMCFKRRDWKAKADIMHQIQQEKIDDTWRDLYLCAEADCYIKLKELGKAVSVLRRGHGRRAALYLSDLGELHGPLPSEPAP